MIPFDKYLVWRCPKCGAWQGKQNNKWTIGMSEAGKAMAIRKLMLKCISCRKTTKFHDREKGGVRTQHYWAKHPYDASRIVQHIKSQGKQS